MLNHGRAGHTPVAVIEWGTYDRQRVVSRDFNDIADKSEAENIGNPAIIVVGEVVNCRHEMAWYDARPLFGKRILVTRSGGNNDKLSKLLRDAGAQVVAKPAQHFQAPENWSDIDARIDQLQQGVYTWLAFVFAKCGAFFL